MAGPIHEVEESQLPRAARGRVHHRLGFAALPLLPQVEKASAIFRRGLVQLCTNADQLVCECSSRRLGLLGPKCARHHPNGVRTEPLS